jgi:radical SAM protein with 4Fe4S-binding SPASM domain
MINYPSRVAIDVTGNCNYRCKYCWFKYSGLDYPDISGMQLSLEECNKIFDDMVALGIPMIHFSGGGEPLVHPQIKEILQSAIDHNLPFSLATNGYLIDDEIFRLLTEPYNWIRGRKGAMFVAFSFWAGDRKNYSLLHGVPEENFDIVLNNLKRIAKTETWTVVSFTIFPDNYNLIYDTLKLVAENGVKQIYIRKGFTPLKMDILDSTQMTEVERQISQIKTEFPDLRIGHGDVIGYEFDYSKPQNIDYCKYFRNMITISCDGKVYPCCLLRYKTDAVIGDIRKKSFKEIMENDWIPFMKKFVCKTYFCTLSPINPMERQDKELKEECEKTELKKAIEETGFVVVG